MKGVRVGMDCCQLLIGHFDACGIGSQVALGMDVKSLPSRSCPDEIDYDLVALQRTTTPIHADVGEQAVLNLVPFAGPRWQMANGDGQPRLRCPSSYLDLPQPQPVAVAAATVRADEQLLGVGVQHRRHLAPLNNKLQTKQKKAA